MSLVRRRRDKERMRGKAIKAYPDWPDAYKWADHMAGCSCPMCSNPRKHLKQKSRQEKKADLILRDYKIAG